MRAELKARILTAGTARLTGEPSEIYIARSTAGPGAGSEGSVFFSSGGRRVRLSLSPTGPVEICHTGNGNAVLYLEDIHLTGIIEKPGLHCPKQAYITVTSACIFRCRYCSVPGLSGRKSPEEIESLVNSVLSDIEAISLTSGVLTTIEEEEDYVVDIVKKLNRFDLPIGVSIYPTRKGPEKLKLAGVSEVKFNVEAATPALFQDMCPDLDRDEIIQILRESVSIFGRNHVFSNVILGLGEKDEEMEACIEALCKDGIIPVIRPLHPGNDLSGFSRPESIRLMKIHRFLSKCLEKNDLNPKEALTMCPACTGCDLIPGRDI